MIGKHGDSMPTSKTRATALFLALIAVLGRIDPGAAAIPPTAACRLLERVATIYDLPGFTAAEADRTGSVLEFAIGRSANGGRIAPGAKFLSGSIGKTFVAALAMDLYERHVLDLDAPVQSWLGDESWYREFPNASQVTLRQLLTHSSGWPSHVDMPGFQRAISKRVNACATCLFSPMEALQFLRGSRPLFAPGTGWYYSEANYLVAGLIIEKATHRPYYGLLEERILRPLGLSDTVPSNTNRIPGLVAGKIDPKTNYFGIDASSTSVNGVLRYNPGLEWTGGGLAASSGDLARWGALLYSGRALPEPYLQDLFASVPAGPNARYGLAVDIKRVGGVLYYGHTGSIPGYRSVLRYFPATQLAVAAQIDADLNHDGPIYDSLVTATLEAARMVGGIDHGRRFRGIDCRS